MLMWATILFLRSKFKMANKYDFSGWATKNDLLCADGRVIRRDAFKDNDGQTVPLVYQHQHSDPASILGHALLENRDDGVYAYCSFNDTPNAQLVKSAVQHGDVVSLSIYANRLVQEGKDVLHGLIREVSIVLAGANPGAYIDNPILVHGEGTADESYEDLLDEAVLIEAAAAVSLEIAHRAVEPDRLRQVEPDAAFLQRVQHLVRPRVRCAIFHHRVFQQVAVFPHSDPEPEH